MNIKLCLLAGVCVTSLVQPAFAQDVKPAAAVDTVPDIIVTAQRTSQRLQDVPIAITAANAEALAQARVLNVSNIGTISPSITFHVNNNSSASSNLVIRGLGTNGISRAFEGSVGVFIDGVYRTRAGSALHNFLDIDNLQVVRGPQGTLFGKNTTAGALLLDSTKPSTTERAGSIEASYGNYDSHVVRAAVNLPLGDNAALRVAGLTSHTDGFFTDATTGSRINGDTTKAVKGQLLWKPSSDVSVRLIADYSHSQGVCCYATYRVTKGRTQPAIASLTLANGLKLPSTNPSDFQVSLNYAGDQTIEDYGATLMIDAQLGTGSLKSVTAYRRFNVFQAISDGDFSGADIINVGDRFKNYFASQELTYNTNIAALNAETVFGAFVAKETIHDVHSLFNGSQAEFYYNALLGLPPHTVSANPGLLDEGGFRATSESYALFGHADFKLTDELHLITGVRYSIEHKTGSYHSLYTDPAPNAWATVLGLRPSPEYRRTHTDRAFSGTLGLQYEFSRDAMVYATFNHGFKAGGVNIDENAAGLKANLAVPLDPTYRPETVNAYEVGAKFQYLDRRARTNISFYYYDVKNMQIAQYVGTRFQIISANQAKDYGAEIENSFQLTKALALNADAIWIPHAQYGTVPGVLANARFRFAPKVSANVGLNLDTPLTDQVDLLARVQYRYTASQYINTAALNVQGRVGLVNANLGVKIGQRYTIEGWVQNLTKKTYFDSVVETPLQAGTQEAFVGAPRTFGVRVHATF
ncbi:TonB-dependent receptor [Sphingomonas sp. Root710]|uniref:TonB-dependent receptor n=1 Tax=Sphingomonas sp. Root710 TaxID=1736594 RepID=UPI0006FFAA2A|nr:TonB-dependent receptor [Sphingomonas sp. Root710]KRB82366.1 TonB-dependent receptor [Sphingomonas sp. Root710]